MKISKGTTVLIVLVESAMLLCLMLIITLTILIYGEITLVEPNPYIIIAETLALTALLYLNIMSIKFFVEEWQHEKTKSR